MFRLARIVCFVLAAVVYTTRALRPVDEHPCYRSCEFDRPMTCTYNWTVDWFYTLSQPECGSCPSNEQDCSNKNCVPVDGFPRAVSVVNKVFPAPSIQICSGDEVVVNFANNMLNSEGVTIHWHGIFQNGSQYMDGLPMVTQCPVPSPGFFQYRFVPYEPGTHWLHAHTGLQRADGMMGSFIIREGSRSDPSAGLYDQDLADHVIFMNDWHHDVMVTVYQKSNRAKDGANVDAILINGKGIWNVSLAPHPPLEVFNVIQDVRYRFRVINGASFFCNMQFSVENHRLLVIASDGGSIVPQAVDYFRINSGERYDFVLTANQSIGNYQIRVVGLSCTNQMGEPSQQIAFLHYDGAPTPPTIDVLPDNVQYGNSSTWWKAFPNKSLAEVNAAVDPDYRSTDSADDQYYIEVDLVSHTDPSTMESRRYPQLNNISFTFPTSPLLSQFNNLPRGIFCNESDFPPGSCGAADKICSCVHTINVQLNQRVEIVLVNPQSDFSVLHPMHLHGQQFKIVAMDKIDDATVEMVKELDSNGMITRNNNGPRKDVVVVPNGGYTIFQFQGWNPGWWIFHCHIEFHLEEGMALLFNVGKSSDLPPVPTDFPRCGVWPPVAELGGPSPGVFPTDAGTVNPRIGTSPIVWAVPVTAVVSLLVGIIVAVAGQKFWFGRDDDFYSSPSVRPPATAEVAL